MLLDISIDGHMHTHLCHHASGKMEEYVQVAINKGLACIYFLEHMETGIDYFESTWLSDDDFDLYFAEGKRLQQKYSDRLAIGLGVEVGYNPNRQLEILARLSQRQWDRIGISYHFIETDSGYLNMFSKKQANLEQSIRIGVDGIISSYLIGLCDAVESLPGNVLCHFDAVLRHIPNIRFTDEHHLLINKLLDAVKKKGMSIEVNTSGYPIRNETFPALPFIKEAVRRGISLVAGSDAHRPEDVGRHFDRLQKLINDLLLT